MLSEMRKSKISWVRYWILATFEISFKYEIDNISPISIVELNWKWKSTAETGIGWLTNKEVKNQLVEYPQ